MSHQIYRKGIPSSSSYDVADKVGFLDEYINDSAIIYTNKGPLLLSIYSSGYSWDIITDIASNIISNCD